MTEHAVPARAGYGAAVGSREPTAGPRLVFVDGMRALAALSVFAFHVLGPALADLGPLGAKIAESVIPFGKYGVQVFFVLSGFVIAHSLRSAVVTPGFVLRFVARRSIRLDPTFWVTIAVTLGSVFLSNHLDRSRQIPYPPALEVAANLLYLQDVVGYPRVLEVSWSLCIEIQLYIVFVCLLGVINRIRMPAAAVSGVIAVFVGSLLGAFLSGLPGQVWFISYLYLFLVGAVVAWHGSGRLGAAPVLLSVTLVAVCSLLFRAPGPAIGAATALLLLLAQKVGKLTSWLSERPVQFVGRLSYSFYLVHTLVASRMIGVGRRIIGPGFERSLLYVAITFAVSLLGAWLLFRFVERPSMMLARRVRL